MTVCPASGRTQTDARIGLGRGERFGQTIALAGLHMKEERAAPHGIAAATCEINARVGSVGAPASRAIAEIRRASIASTWPA